MRKMVTESPRGLALSILCEIETAHAFANLALGRLPAELDQRDRSLATELVAGTTRMRRALDHALDEILAKPIATLPPAIRNGLRMGAYQILYLSRIPPHAAVGEAVALARRFGHEGTARLTNAVLRELARRGMAKIKWPDDPAARIALQESYPDGLVARWIAEFGLDGAARLARAQNEPPPFSLRANRLKVSRAELISRFRDAGIECEPSPVTEDGIRLASGAITRLPGYDEGWWYVQGEGAMLAARVLNPGPGQRVADIGAAPGGKTTHLAELMGDRGRVLAIDAHPGRLALVADNARRLGLKTIEPTLRDARQPFDMPIDGALVDAPCSGLGTLYRKADLRWRARPEEIPELARLQRQLLDAVASAIVPGGALVYSTCTVSHEENGDVIRQFLADHPEFARCDFSFALPEDWRHAAAGGTIQLLPHVHGTEGFFIARVVKSDPGES